ncbi:MAG: radical SAM protein [Veillonellales bacterium]
MFYRLHHDCRLVKGASRGAIYDLQSGKVYSINRGAREILSACQEHPLAAVVDSNNPDNECYLKFLDRLTAKKIGALYTYEPEIKTTALPAAPVTLDFLWLELTANCNNRCLHCYATSGPCQQEADLVPHERWLQLITEARQAGATALQLIGGEPLMYKKWQELVLKAETEGFNFIEIFTNATLIDDTCVAFLQQHHVNVATTIYADNADIHDRITQHPGSFDKTMAAIKKILAADIPLRIASIIMKTNEQQADNIMKLCEKLGVEITPPDVVRPTGRGDDRTLLPEHYARPPIKPPFHTDAESFTKAQQYHSCLAGKIAVTADGNIIPCIFARSQMCGNIITSSLAEILNGTPLQQCWYTTKDQVEKCRDCEYRYACADCRPLAQGSDPQKNWLACSCGCNYNPYTGIWE